MSEITADERTNQRVEIVAEWLSWVSGEMTRWSEDAHPDHNRWSWQGDGHGEVMREEFREQARLLLRASAAQSSDDGGAGSGLGRAETGPGASGSGSVGDGSNG